MITLDQARYHLRIDGTQHDAEIQQKLVLATSIVADYIGNNTQTNGDIEDAAILLALGELWLNREAGISDVLSSGLRLLLERQRVLALA